MIYKQTCLCFVYYIIEARSQKTGDRIKKPEYLNLVNLVNPV